MSLDITLEKVAQPLGGPSPVANGWSRLASSPAIAAQYLRPITASLGGKLYVYGGDAANGVLSSADGIAWNAQKGNFPARNLGGGAAFDGKLFLVGGEGKADTWISADGVLWAQLGPPAAWGPRWGHAMTAFKGHLYLLGGVKGVRPQSDVWALEPGGMWRQVKADAFSARVFCAAGVVGGSMLLLGGEEDAGAIAQSLVSTDGATWTSYAVPWAARFGAAAVTLGDTLYLVGGQGKQDSGIVFNDVWATKDGIAWSRIDASAPALTQFAGGAIGDQLVVLGGLKGATPNPDASGLRPQPSGWQLVSQSSITGLYAAVLPYAGKLWAFSGDSNHAVVSSTDGVTWVDEANDLPFRRGAAATLHNNALWICGGDGELGHTSEVRTSSDGKHWTLVTGAAGWPGRQDHCMVSFNGKLYVYAGHGRTTLNDVWSSADGVSWTRETAAAFGDVGRSAGAGAVLAGKMWMFGGEISGNAQQEAWSSTDGKTWAKKAPPWSARFHCGAVLLDGTLYIVGGNAVGVSRKDVWGTRDGVTWSCFDDTAPWGYMGGQQYGAIAGALFMFGGSAGPYSHAVYRFQPM